jgi:AraC-like DNA-binding protein
MSGPPEDVQAAAVPAWLNGVGADALLGLFDYLPDTVAFVKDTAGRYVYVNRTLSQRLRLSRAQLFGTGAEEVFPSALGASFAAQDRAVLAGKPLTEHLELHLYPGGQTGWCLTTKRTLRVGSEVVGVLGVSRDVTVHPAAAPGLAAALLHLSEHHTRPLPMGDLAARAGLSLSGFERQVHRVYGVTPSQLLTRARLDSASRLLRTTDWPVARVAVECGYFDHSAFTRAFRSAVGLTPTQFRRMKWQTLV